MSSDIVARILIGLFLIGASQGLLVVGPKYIRPYQNYGLVVSNYDLGKIDLIVRMVGSTDDGRSILDITKSVDVRPNMNRVINFDLRDLSPGDYKITIEGQDGFSFHKEADLLFLQTLVSGLIQIDKPVFKPGDTVQFRVVVLDTELKPPSYLDTVHVEVQNPANITIRKWSTARLNVGVFEGSLQIAPTPLLGTHNIIVTWEGEELVSKTFEVKEYVLSTFDVEVSPVIVPLLEHQQLNLRISANNVFGQPVSGNIDLKIYSEGRLLSKAIRNIDGTEELALRFERRLNFYDNSKAVDVNISFTELYTNRTLVKSHPIMVFKSLYRAKLEKESPQFRSGFAFSASVKVEHQDGSPAKNVNCRVKVEGIERPISTTYETNDAGKIDLVLQPAINSDTIYIVVSISNHEVLRDEINRVERSTKAFIKTALISEVMLGHPIKLEVTLKEMVPFFVYYVLSKGNIVDEGFVRQSRLIQIIEIEASRKLVPKAKILIATVFRNTVEYDIVDIVFSNLLNDFKLKIDEYEVKPGGQIELEMTARHGSYVALSAYDKSLQHYNAMHDIYWNDVQELFESIHGIHQKEFSIFTSIDLFVRTSDELSIDAAVGTLGRVGTYGMDHQSSKPLPYRTNFAESFLWMNVTIGRSGHFTTIESVPDTTTSWYLTGFSMHPVDGFGIIRKPIQLNTVQAFYIVDHLPYSIKRGEAVVLQFTLFNNLGGSYITEVTLFNVQGQMEFIESSSSESEQIKVLTVPPTVGTPVSFVVKAKKLGEMTVRVKAVNMLETDGIEKVIRVLPESLVEKKMQSCVFSHSSYVNQSFVVMLDIDENADPGSEKITFVVNPNILTSVVQNLESLLGVPSGCGEQNMVHFVPNIIVLDYLTAIGSKEQRLIDKATNLLRQGYQNQIRYRQTDGSFGVWQNDGGSVFLTAFVAKSMQTAAKYITDVDTSMLTKAFEWLVSTQDSSGRFDEVGPIFQKDMQGGLRNGIALTSYVLIALMENENANMDHASVIEKGIKYISHSLAKVTDLYDLSIATYALFLNNHSSKNDVLKKLMNRSTVAPNGTMTYWAREPHSVETTAYALLAMVMAGKYSDGIPVMRWLVNQRYVTGSFPRTQDTFVGLKALTKLTEVISASRNDYTIQLKTPKTTRKFAIDSNSILSVQFEEIPRDTRRMEIDVEGLGFGVLDVKYEYSLNLRNYSHRFDLKVEKLISSTDYELKLKICASFKPKTSTERSNMALVEVNFPSGYVVDNEPISGATTVNPIKNVEIRFGGTSLVIYYDNMGREKNCFIITAYRRFKVALKRPAYVLVHDYYDPRLNAIQVYEVDRQNLCDICEEEDCPGECKK